MKLIDNMRKQHIILYLCLILVLLPSACIVQTTVPSERSTPLALTPGALATLNPEFNELIRLLPTELGEDIGEAPILITPIALQSESASAPSSSTPTTTPTPQTKVCGRSDAVTLLILGIDENAQADAIRLARIDFSEPEINLVAIPRDFYVSVVGFEQYGIERGRINATFGYGEYFLGAGSGAESLADNLAYNFGVQVDHRFVLHLDEIAGYIDAVGGVEVTLEAPASDAHNYFPAGVNQFDGERAVAFMRIREYDSDFRRIDRQTIVLKALLEKVRSGLSPVKVLSLIVALLKDDSTQSDLTLRDMQNFYCLSQQIDKQNIHVREIPSEMFHTYITPGGAWVLIPHAEVPDYIRESLNQ
jgi:LCP family protein required for cell wall assembly